MSCLLFFNFILLLFATILLALGITTSRWIVIPDNNPNHIYSENSTGIISFCQRLYRDGNTEKYVTASNRTGIVNFNYFYDDAYACFNRLFKWHNLTIAGPELEDKEKALIGLSFGSLFLAIIALLLTQLINTNASFHNYKCSKRMVECLLICDILTVVLALITLALFLGFQKLRTLTAYGFSFWSYIGGTCCIFISCIVTAVYRIDVEFELRRYRHESVATLC